MHSEKKRILVTDSLSQRGIEILKEKGYDVTVEPSLDGETLANAISGYEALLIRSGTTVTEEIINKADNLRIIGRAGVGVDNVDVEAATRKGIVVMNVPAGNTVSACEHTWALIMSLLRNIPAAHQALTEGRWDKKKFQGTELYGKTLGVFGLGKIGYEVASRAGVFGMKVIACDPFTTEELASRIRAKLVGFDELLEHSDIITIHTPLNDKTRNLFNSETLGRMKSSAVLINCARGGIVDEAALADAVKNGTIKGAAVDVYPKEPTTDSPLFAASNVVHTPHLGAATAEAQERVAIEIVQQVAQYVDTGQIINAVNALAQEVDPLLQELAEKLGMLCGRLATHLTKKVIISYKYSIKNVGETLTQFVLKGYLSQFSEGVNVINAHILARDRGIEIVSQSVEGNDLHGELKVSLEPELIIEGGIVGEVARLTGLNGHIFDIPLSGSLLIIKHADRPGMVGNIGVILGEYGINIASMEVGRKSAGGQAVTVIEVDDNVAEHVVEKLNSVEFIDYVKNIKVGQ